MIGRLWKQSYRRTGREKKTWHATWSNEVDRECDFQLYLGLAWRHGIMSTTKSMLGPIQVQVQWVRGHRLHKSQYPLVNEKNINFSYLEINGLVPDILITNVRKTLSLSQLFQLRILDALEGPISFLPFFFSQANMACSLVPFQKTYFWKYSERGAARP